MIYIQLEEAILKERGDGFICRMTRDVEEARVLDRGRFQLCLRVRWGQAVQEAEVDSKLGKSGVGVSKSGVGGI